MKNYLLIAIFTLLAGSTIYGQTNYQLAVGIKAGYGFGITGKYALYNDDMVEGILTFRDKGNRFYDYNITMITALYEIYGDLGDVTEGLTWYYGAGAHIGFLSGDYEFIDVDLDGLFLGATGVIGLDYSFMDIPLNLSFDWAPRINIIGGGQGFFDPDGGVLGIRYIIR